MTPPASPRSRYARLQSLPRSTDFPAPLIGSLLGPAYQQPAGYRLTCHPIGINFQRYGNMNPFPISYAFRPHLRGRLTLGRLPLPRKPQAFGGQVFHLSFRYSYRHPPFRHLQETSQSPFFGIRNAPLPLHVRRRRTRDVGAEL
jgi:hypothetical protein